MAKQECRTTCLAWEGRGRKIKKELVNTVVFMKMMTAQEGGRGEWLLKISAG